jgi:mevalonate kinase
MTFDGDALHVERVPVNNKNIEIVIVDLNGAKNTQLILSSLQQAYPPQSNSSESELALHDLFGATNERIVKQAVKFLAEGDARGIGELMVEAQALFDKIAVPFCVSELQAPLLHRVLKLAEIQHLIWGGKLIGSGGDGSAQFVCRSEDAAKQLVQFLQERLALAALHLTLPTNATRLRKAVIPAAGFGTRMFPATKMMKKELFPIVDWRYCWF